MAGILVGVDGSDNSRRALVWAVQEAARRHLSLRVLTVRPPALRPATHIFWNIPDDLEEEEPDGERKAVQDFVSLVARETGDAIPEITVELVTGDPAEQLIRASREAELLVVGRRGSGGFASLMLGSVSSKVTHHAACPTVVIPGPGRGAAMTAHRDA
jgi:nucleotide-binding universal stress UspA family protein